MIRKIERELKIFPKPRKIVIGKKIINRSEFIDENKLLNISIFPEKNLEKKFLIFKLKDLCKFFNAKDIKICRDKKEKAILIICDNTDNIPSQGYILNIGEKGIEIKSKYIAGLNYGLITFKQLLQNFKEDKLPFIYIEDYPDFENRGIMLDISRGKVPKMETLYDLIEKFSFWKINQLQLYTEHTFAYKGHEIVWKNSSPITPEEIKKIDEFCKEKFIELVPNQNCFGHLHRWLKLKEYRHLAEDPENPSALCPTDPNSITFIENLLSQLLPNFSSNKVNIGCDEVKLGVRSKEEIKKYGEGKVYLDFILKIINIANKYGKEEILIWADVIKHYPNLFKDLPKNITLLEWGYSSTHPFYLSCEMFSKNKIDFYVCPGTSSWNSIGGIWENCRVNLLNAAINGSRYNAKGYLITDWGDNGHWQHLPISYPGFLYGAGVSWCWRKNYDVNIEEIVGLYALNRNLLLSKILIDLSKVSFSSGVYTSNGSPFFYLFHEELDEFPDKKWKPQMAFWIGKEGLKKAEKQIKKIEKYLKKVDSNILETIEIKHAIKLLKHSFLRAKLIIEKYQRENFNSKILLKLIKDSKEIIKEFKKIWKYRYREGGLKESTFLMENLLIEKYKSLTKK
ncbi:MAG: family 20 glycosylhydrolase [bacterium]|nr:family 20 glycosylhydrolase [bacterium]